MRIGIDAHHINGKPQGSRTHLIELVRALARLTDEEIWIYSFRPQETAKVLDVSTLIHRRIFPESAQLRVPFVTPALELAHRLSLFHSQYIAPPASFVPQVVTIHDILFETHPQLFVGAFSRRSVALIRRSARRARVVLTVSEYSRRAIIERYGLSNERVVVTPNAVDPTRYRPQSDIESDLEARYGLRRPYVLNVGRLEPRKNLERLIRAFGRVRERIDPSLVLALAGDRDFGYETTLSEAARLREGAARWLGPVDDEDLPSLYRGATALAYPSLAEGFGMPVLEAMACGIPVLTSPRGALPEVAGDAALMVDPEDEEALAAGLEKIHSDESLRKGLIARGLARARGFDWEESARRTLAAYRVAVERAL
ncbi:MAG TPA: glycosyltransferase family 1 protein [Vicinamibacteria bacterium]|nr:glycosyltransferase family 1 protein [Vicinamibacteria bacterium]